MNTRPVIDNRYRDEASGFAARLFERACNASSIRRMRRALFSRLPFLALESDVTDIVYINWLVDRSALRAWYPAEFELVDFAGKTLISILSYRHGHFRPTLLNPLRRLFPSPLQSNWRFYLARHQQQPTADSVLFVKNIMNQRLFTLGTRLSSDAMLTHYSRHFEHRIEPSQVVTQIQPRAGSCPDLDFRASFASELKIPSALQAHFPSTEAALRMICLQHLAYTPGSDFSGCCEAEIDLPIDVQQARPLAVEIAHSDLLAPILTGAEVFAFVIPAVKFRVLNEWVLTAKPPPADTST